MSSIIKKDVCNYEKKNPDQKIYLVVVTEPLRDENEGVVHILGEMGDRTHVIQKIYLYIKLKFYLKVSVAKFAPPPPKEMYIYTLLVILILNLNQPC